MVTLGIIRITVAPTGFRNNRCEYNRKDPYRIRIHVNPLITSCRRNAGAVDVPLLQTTHRDLPDASTLAARGLLDQCAEMVGAERHRLLFLGALFGILNVLRSQLFDGHSLQLTPCSALRRRAPPQVGSLHFSAEVDRPRFAVVLCAET